jgi:hypothetical protein
MKIRGQRLWQLNIAHYAYKSQSWFQNIKLSKSLAFFFNFKIYRTFHILPLAETYDWHEHTHTHTHIYGNKNSHAPASFQVCKA